MGSYSREDILRLVEEEDIQFIRMQFTDLFGQLKNVAITASQIGRALNGEIMLDGSSIQGSVRVEESDQYLRPDLNTFAILPWRPQYGKVARLICDIYNPDGTPFDGDPRNILKRTLKKAEELGYAFHVGPELEFFLFQTDEEGRPTAKTSDEAGYFDLGPLDHGESTRREVALALEKMGVEIEASHHESAAGQHEIDLKYTDALAAADNIMTFKLAVKTLAQKNGLYATFMPKPLRDAAGNGMHVNMSLFQDGRNLFYDETGERKLSPLARQFIAGLLEHARGFCALTNPVVNSYKRLVPGYEAPCYLAWSESNRSALIRIPDPRGRGTRVELRSPDTACNPYLAFAACLSAGLDGVTRELTPPPAAAGNLYAMTAEELAERNIRGLPASLDAALRAMETDGVVMEALGPYAIRYAAGKRREWEEYRTQISQWELDNYLASC
ncbi:MAG: type I glutamate--ammonia ligase [Oscillospiraceae bacterium]|jgi:glutamine synthetase|nr:type I glutamate--ammonia ligase [Oscillospiraceae bacterium]MCI8720980.1 type I glutamate--ammonia ligase [Oscillospiraceae bacterium]MCI8943455.1 type I glutamate--ammonia ligase [Oscillospiraceae bacterium]